MLPQSLTHGTTCKIAVFFIVVFAAVQYLFVQYGTSIQTYSHGTLFYIPLNGVSGRPPLQPLQPAQLSSAQLQRDKSPRSSNLAALLLANATVGPSVLEILVSHAGRNATAGTTLQPEAANKTATTNSTRLPLCPPVPANLKGPTPVKLTAPPEKKIETLITGVTAGGRYSPTICRARSRVAIIIPYRDRVENLNAFLYHMHPFLQKQQLEYGIIVVEQKGTGPFNRAMLMNVGFVESQKLHEYDCFIFHDVDLLPEDDRNLYTCPEQPRHMSVAVNTMKYRLPYKDIFGGVSAMTLQQFKAVNGFSNKFWGWGGEDDDMANRVKSHGFHISRYPANIARYKMMVHRRQPVNPKRHEYLYNGQKRFNTDGLNSLKYVRAELEQRKLYTWVLVELAQAR